MNFAFNQEKRVENFVASSSISDETGRSKKTVGTRSGITYRLWKVHKNISNNCAPFRLVLSAINTPTYKLAKFLVNNLKYLISNEYKMKDSFAFAKEIVEKMSEFLQEA